MEASGGEGRMGMRRAAVAAKRNGEEGGRAGSSIRLGAGSTLGAVAPLTSPKRSPPWHKSGRVCFISTRFIWVLSCSYSHSIVPHEWRWFAVLSEVFSGGEHCGPYLRGVSSHCDTVVFSPYLCHLYCHLAQTTATPSYLMCSRERGLKSQAVSSQAHGWLIVNIDPGLHVSLWKRGINPKSPSLLYVTSTHSHTGSGPSRWQRLDPPPTWSGYFLILLLVKRRLWEGVNLFPALGASSA
ncbi:unnamed protein product [Pleuronectes platessa]|uniref:Uncharacterized protein n=1 Tax=Pleuronectes platessa TaxID=8262 RepID=A0A9N7UNL1_PLEPL|nr:unnamed protein product [Pleuronectes platessa]